VTATPKGVCAVNASTTYPTTVQIRRVHLVGLILATAAVAAVITWLLVAVAFDSGATPTQSTSLRGVVTPAAVTSTAADEWPGQPPYPPGFRGMP
jgi:hypothetical protein